MLHSHISKNLTIADYYRVRDLTNLIAESTGKSVWYINSEMYLAGGQSDPLIPVMEKDVIKLLYAINGSHTRSDHLLDYCARSFNPSYDHAGYYRILKERITVAPDTAPATPGSSNYLHINATEVQIHKRRISFFSKDREAYDRALKQNPTKEDLEWFALREPCWSLLFPIKAYLLDHPEIKYRGLQPIGSAVIRYFNKFIDYLNNQVIDNQSAPITTVSESSESEQD